MTAKSISRSDYETSATPMGVMPKDYPDGFEVGVHQHSRGQFIYATSGLMKISTDQAFWLVPPQHALWMPPGLDHNMQAIGHVTLRTLYVRADVLPVDFPSRPKVVQVLPLLRELILRAATVPIEYAENSHEARILDLLLGEIRLACQTIDFCLAPAKDKRLSRVCHAILSDPANDTSLDDWAKFSGTSVRTLARLFRKEFGVTFILWRQQVRMMAALPRLASGESVTSIATDLGYESPGAFTQVFRRLMGAVPSTYFED